MLLKFLKEHQLVSMLKKVININLRRNFNITVLYFQIKLHITEHFS